MLQRVFVAVWSARSRRTAMPPAESTPPANENKGPKSSAMAHARGCTQCLCSLYGVMAQSETRGAAADVHAVPIIAAAAKDEPRVAEVP